MSKLQKAVEAAEKLPPEMREQLGDDLLHYIDKYLALRAELEIGLAQLDRGEGVPWSTVMANLRKSGGA